MNRATMSLSVSAVLASVILVGCGGGGGGLSDPGLSNVQVEVGNARSTVITPTDGGTITATGSNGFVYKLTIPPGAVQSNTQVAMYPIKAIKNLPTGGTISGGVNFSPDGLQLTIPATLTIQVPASVDPKKAVPIAYTGNGDSLHLDPGTVAGQTITTQVYHFSGTAIGNRTIADLLHSVSILSNTTTQFQHRMADAFWRSEQSNTSPLADYLLILRNWYDLIVRPKLTTGGRPNSTFNEINKAIAEYTAWLDGILYAQRTLGDPAFNIQPENSESEPLEVAVIKRWYQFYNDLCVRDKNNALDAGLGPDGEVQSPLDAASLAMIAGFYADFQHIPRAANGLDKATLLNNLCVKVVIESKSYDGNAPGDEGTAKVKAGFTIDGGAARHDAPIRVKFSGNGNLLSDPVIIVNGATANKAVHWPVGVDPLKIDILASLKDNSDIAVFDRITKTAQAGGGGSGSIVFVSNRDIDIEIYSMNADGSSQTRLTNSSGPDEFPAISPEGSKIAFVSTRDHRNNIYVMDADGKNPRRLTFTVLNDLEPSWSPDGAKIVFSSDRDGNREIYIMNADRTNQKRLTNDIGPDASPAFSPDGKKIAFTSNRNGKAQIFVMNVDGTSQTGLTNNPRLNSDPAWSPDGKKIAFTSSDNITTDIFVMDADGSNQKRLTNNAAQNFAASWNRAGTKIAFVSNRDGSSTEEIYIMDANGGNPARLTKNQALNFQPSF